MTDLSVKIRNASLVKRYRGVFEAVYYSIRRVQARKDLKKNLSLKNRYAGQRCFIFGTGASINDVDLERFSGEATFACNSFFLHPQFEKMNLRFFSAVDSIYGLSNNHVPWYKPTIFFPKLEEACRACPTAFFFNFSSRAFIRSHGLFAGRPVHYVVNRRQHPETGLTVIDLHQENDFMIGATYFMVAASIYMGFKELYLFGMGFTYEPTQHGHFYDPPDVLEEVKNFPNRDIDERNCRLRKIAEDNAVQIFNVTPDGFESPVYEAISLEGVYRLLKKREER